MNGSKDFVDGAVIPFDRLTIAEHVLEQFADDFIAVSLSVATSADVVDGPVDVVKSVMRAILAWLQARRASIIKLINMLLAIPGNPVSGTADLLAFLTELIMDPEAGTAIVASMENCTSEENIEKCAVLVGTQLRLRRNSLTPIEWKAADASPSTVVVTGTPTGDTGTPTGDTTLEQKKAASADAAKSADATAKSADATDSASVEGTVLLTVKLADGKIILHSFESSVECDSNTGLVSGNVANGAYAVVADLLESLKKLQPQIVNTCAGTPKVPKSRTPMCGTH
jgi:hypothetical protein